MRIPKTSSRTSSRLSRRSSDLILATLTRKAASSLAGGGFFRIWRLLHRRLHPATWASSVRGSPRRSAGGASAEIALPVRRSWPSGDSARPAGGFPWLTSSAFRPRFPGVSRPREKPRKIFAEPLAPRGSFWYITHPLRRTGRIPAARREIFDSGGASRTRSRGSRGGSLRKGRGTQEHGKLVVMPGAAKAAPLKLTLVFLRV